MKIWQVSLIWAYKDQVPHDAWRAAELSPAASELQMQVFDFISFASLLIRKETRLRHMVRHNTCGVRGKILYRNLFKNIRSRRKFYGFGSIFKLKTRRNLTRIICL